jgi:hypothetical protein
MTKINDTLANRLAKQSTVTDCGCIEWTGDRLSSGYGRISINYKTKRVHRVSYELSIGPIPEGMCVLHRCDNPPCFNPDHLFLGTNKENTEDMYNKGRQNPPVGVRNGNAKLTPEQVLQIRKDTRSLDTIAAEYPVSRSIISLIRIGKIWTHIK